MHWLSKNDIIIYYVTTMPSCKKPWKMRRNYGMSENVKPSLLLHSCCGPCSTAVIERLLDRFELTVFFYNPNMSDIEEYERRTRAQRIVIERFNQIIGEGRKIKYIESPYEPEEFYKVVSGYENEPEGGKRCTKCFGIRLGETAKLAEKEGYDYFATTLTVSPHKDSKLISQIGNGLEEKYNIKYLDENFKKKDGFKRSIELSKEFGLYRQDYCGCKYSIWWDSEEERIEAARIADEKAKKRALEKAQRQAEKNAICTSKTDDNIIREPKTVNETNGEGSMKTTIMAS